jgi:hypothetical protein
MGSRKEGGASYDPFRPVLSTLDCFLASATCVFEEHIMSGYEWDGFGFWEGFGKWSAREALHCNTTCFNKRLTRAISWRNLISIDVPKRTEFGKGPCAAANRDLLLYLLAQTLVFRNSDLNKSTTICKVGDLEAFPKAFLDLETYTRS